MSDNDENLHEPPPPPTDADLEPHTLVEEDPWYLSAIRLMFYVIMISAVVYLGVQNHDLRDQNRDLRAQVSAREATIAELNEDVAGLRSNALSVTVRRSVCPVPTVVITTKPGTALVTTMTVRSGEVQFWHVKDWFNMGPTDTLTFSVLPQPNPNDTVTSKWEKSK